MKLELVKQRKYVIFFFAFLGICHKTYGTKRSMIETYLKNDGKREGEETDSIRENCLNRAQQEKHSKLCFLILQDRLQHLENTFRQVVSILRTQSP